MLSTGFRPEKPTIKPGCLIREKAFVSQQILRRTRNPAALQISGRSVKAPKDVTDLTNNQAAVFQFAQPDPDIDTTTDQINSPVGDIHFKLNLGEALKETGQTWRHLIDENEIRT